MPPRDNAKGLGTINGEYRKRLREETPEITLIQDQCTRKMLYGRDADGNLYYQHVGDDVWYKYQSSAGSWV